MPENSISIIYMTAASSDEARNIAETLVDSGIVACANIIGPMVSVYKWQGEMQTAGEYAVIMKTATANVKKATGKIMEMHSYDCPCVVSWPVSEGNPEFLKWVSESSL